MRTASTITLCPVMERLGIAKQLKDAVVPVDDIVAKGEAEIGMQQINVIQPAADYVGPLPAELQYVSAPNPDPSGKGNNILKSNRSIPTQDVRAYCFDAKSC